MGRPTDGELLAEDTVTGIPRGVSEPTGAQFDAAVAYLVRRVKAGWTPPLDFRLRFGLTTESLAAIRASAPPEPDLLAE